MKRYFRAAIPIKVVARLEKLLQDHPELGFRSASEAVKHAVVQFTDDLEQRIRGKAPEASPSVTVDELVHILQRYTAQKRAGQESPEATRKPRS